MSLAGEQYPERMGEMEYNGDAISEIEWDVADEYETNRHESDNHCLICGEPINEYGSCINGCHIED